MIWLFALAFSILLLAPLLIASIYYRRNQGEVLGINQEKTRDPRYFGKSFANLIQTNMDQANNCVINLSKAEEYIDGELEDKSIKVIDKLVIAKKADYRSRGIERFEKEIYAGRNLILSGHKYLRLRAAYSQGDMLVASNTSFVRWLDSKGTLAIYDNCDLGISASSAVGMSIGRNCKFQRLYAPEIRIGQYPGDEFDPREGKNPKIYNMPIQMNKEKNIRYVNDEMVNKEGVIDFTIISDGNLNINENIIIQGDVRSHKGVRLSEGAVVCGNIFAEGDIYLGKNSCVLGNVFSQENIYFEERAVVGQKSRICSVIAREAIVFEGRNFVFGYISCEEEGIIRGEEGESSGGKSELLFLKAPEKRTRLEFKDLYEFEHVDQQGFRLNRDIEEAIIPKGAREIPKSMFFKCESLQRIDLPASLKRIGAYSFADCKSLEDIALKGCPGLDSIGASAFENCKSLEKIEIPADLTSISGGAFSGCSSLEKVSFEESSKLEVLEDHSFRGCKSLRKIRLPERVRKIGVSSFRECSGLERIILPERCKGQAGIVEIPEEKLVFYKVDKKKVY